jgi:hypothetical protein
MRQLFIILGIMKMEHVLFQKHPSTFAKLNLRVVYPFRNYTKYDHENIPRCLDDSHLLRSP